MASFDLRLSPHPAKLVKCRSNKDFRNIYWNERTIIQRALGSRKLRGQQTNAGLELRRWVASPRASRRQIRKYVVGILAAAITVAARVLRAARATRALVVRSALRASWHSSADLAHRDRHDRRVLLPGAQPPVAVSSRAAWQAHRPDQRGPSARHRPRRHLRKRLEVRARGRQGARRRHRVARATSCSDSPIVRGRAARRHSNAAGTGPRREVVNMPLAGHSREGRGCRARSTSLPTPDSHVRRVPVRVRVPGSRTRATNGGSAFDAQLHR